MWSVPNRGSAAKRKVHSICRRANVEIFIDFIVSVFTLMSLACLTGSSLATWCAELKEESRPGRDWLKSAEGPEPSCKHPSGLAKKTFPVKHTTHTSKSTHTQREAHRSTQKHTEHKQAHRSSRVLASLVSCSLGTPSGGVRSRDHGSQVADVGQGGLARGRLDWLQV